jgi:hypothetical protein
MKIYIYSLLLFFTVGLCSAQLVSLSQAEYFWDTDPGEGNGIAISAVDGNFNSSFEKISVSGLGAPSVGMHKFSVRVKDSQGIWSPVFTNIVNVESVTSLIPASLSQAEYFWDTDPGEGSAIPLLATDGNFNSAFEKVAVTGLNAPSTGMHKFSVRVKDNQGIWSPIFTNIVNVEATTTPTPISLSQAEYFWDTDPGEGSGTAFLATDGNFDSAFEKIQKTAIPIVNPVGLHIFNVRVKDNSGVWGPVFKNAIFIESVLANNTFTFTKVIIYPNPVKDILNLSFDKEITNVSIHTLLGQEVLNKNINANEGTVDVSNLSVGTYLVKVTSNDGIKTLKIIKE